MKKVYIIIISILVYSGLQAQDSSWLQSCDKYLGAQFENGMFNGYALIVDSGKVRLSKAYGKADYSGNIDCTADTKFLVGSLTKQFTAVLVLQQVQSGKLKLDETVQSFLPEIKAADKITVRELLNHTSGLPNFTDFPEYANFEERDIEIAGIVKKIAEHPMIFEPGTSYSYCNSDYLLLGVILEKATGKTYEQLLQSGIFVPAGMTNSGAYFSNRKYSGFATGYADDVLNRTRSIKPHAEFAFAAGQVYSTANDLLKWNNYLDGDKVLRNDLKQQMFTPGKDDYGFGWVIKKAGDITVEFHSGALPGFRSSFYRIPQKHYAYILLCNMDSPSLTEQISNELLSYYFGKPYTAPVFHKVIHVDSTVLQKYAGKYQVNPNFYVDVTIENGKLMIQGTNQEKHEFYPETANSFFVKFADAGIIFNVSNGTVTQATLLQGDNKVIIKKIP